MSDQHTGTPHDLSESIQPGELEPATLDDVAPTDEKKAKTNRTVWIILAVAALAMMACCVGALIISSFSYGVIGEQTNRQIWSSEPVSESSDDTEILRETERTFEVIGSDATIVVNNEVGETIIQRGSDSQVHVLAVIKSWGWENTDMSDDVDISMDQVNGDIHVNAEILSEWTTGRSPSVEITISVPQYSHVEITGDVGSVEISGISGSAMVSTHVGDVSIDDYVGPLDVSVDVGRVRVRDWTMNDNSRLSTNVGEVSVELDRSTSFELDAQTSVGDIKCEFDIDGERHGGIGPNDYLRGIVGDSPEIELELRSNTGDISIERD